SKIKENAACLTVEYSGELVRIPFYEIKYMDVDKNYVTIHSKEDYRIKVTLGEMETKLPENFFRIGRSAIVNLNCIRRVTKTDAMLTDGSMIQLPRGSYDKLNRAIIKHV
nr:LytTR family transcriptional regulator [Lachnospiraceae bacterium]